MGSVEAGEVVSRGVVVWREREVISVVSREREVVARDREGERRQRGGGGGGVVSILNPDIVLKGDFTGRN